MGRLISSTIACGLFLLMTIGPAKAQSEADLKDYLEGRRVVVLVDMPADEDGINIQVDRGRSIDRNDVRKDLRRFGISLREGDLAEITLIKEKGKHIEFQLNGGGWQGVRRASLTYSPAPKSQRHHDLEAELALLPNPSDEDVPENEKKLRLRRILEEDLEELTQQYEAINAQRLAEAREIQARAQEELESRILQGGSRFNLRFDRSVPPEALTPEGLMHILEKYVDFSQEAVDRFYDRQNLQESEAAEDPAYVSESEEPVFEPASADEILKDLRKGLLWEDALALLGSPSDNRHHYEGKLKVKVCTFERTSLGTIDATFVEDVLIQYTISSR